jgi:uncharacterized protein (DUF305 family)
MIEHHEGAVVMAKDFLDTSNQAVADLLESVIASQNAEIEAMRKLLGSAN